MLHDPTSDSIIIYGGANEKGPLNDLWKLSTGNNLI